MQRELECLGLIVVSIGSSREPYGSGIESQKPQTHMSKGTSFQAILVHESGRRFIHVTLDVFVARRL